ncbi:MAG: aromatic ring-hydroxylating oxygenase subunit alpha [Halioglobus sp.]
MRIFASDRDDSQALADEMIAGQLTREGFALDNYFYHSEVIYRRELANIIYQSWLYAGHISQIPDKGDYFLFQVANDSIIVCRDENNQVHALVNSCRHRGARVCEEPQGNRKTFVCPYHGWVYNTDGSLRHARDMDVDTGFSCDQYPLKHVHMHISHGMIFVNLADTPNDFASALQVIEPMIAPYKFETAKIAESRTYKIRANWKFAVENYVECYHCASSHRKYAKMHTLREMWCNVKDQVMAMRQRSPLITGQSADFVKEHFQIYTNAPAFGCDVSHMRYGLYDGYLTGSEDGQAVAPLLGTMKAYDGGAADFQMGPLCFMLTYPDHGVLYSFIPRSQHETDLHVVWFVNGDAQEGRDYDREKLTWLWHNTTLEDEYIISRNAEGALSSGYTPGPLHPAFEVVQAAFLSWILHAIDRRPDKPAHVLRNIRQS